MKYNIHINQYCWYANDLTGLDIVDLALFDAIRSFMISDMAEHIIINHQAYYWISPNLLIKEMPILGITTARGINKRVDNIIKAGLLERCPNNQSTKKTYFRMGENYNKYNCYNENESSALGTVVPSPTWNENSKDNNTIYDYNTNNPIEKSIEKKPLKEETGVSPIPQSSAAPLPHASKSSLKEREEKFIAKVNTYADKYPQKMLDAFVRCWTEPNASGTKMRFEMQQTFEIGRRLATWASKDYNKPTKAETPTSPRKTKWEEMGMTKEEYDNFIKAK